MTGDDGESVGHTSTHGRYERCSRRGTLTRSHQLFEQFTLLFLLTPARVTEVSPSHSKGRADRSRLTANRPMVNAECPGRAVDREGATLDSLTR